jgi:hypothetical protein
VLIVDSLIISGVKFVLTRIAEAVETEMYDESHLRDELLAAQMKLELGEIDDEEFAAIEEQVLAGLREIGERKRGTPQPVASSRSAERKLTVESVSADFGHRDEPGD